MRRLNFDNWQMQYFSHVTNHTLDNPKVSYALLKKLSLSIIFSQDIDSFFAKKSFNSFLMIILSLLQLAMKTIWIPSIPW